MTRLKPAHALAGAIVLLGAGVVASIYQDKAFAQQRVRELTVQAEILAASVTAALVFGDVKTVQEHVSALAINPQIAAVGVYDTGLRLVASFARRGGTPLPPALPRDRTTLEKSIINVPVDLDGERLGTVYVRATKEPAAARLTRHLPIMLLAVMAALLVAVMGAAQRTLSNEMERRSKAEEALRQSQKMEAVGQLAGGVAHDFNNLLSIIQGNLHLLRQTSPGDHEVIEACAAAAVVAADRASNLVRRLLAFSRRQPLSARIVDLNDLAAGMKDLIAHSVGDRIRVEWNLRAKWKTMCDVNQMENVILNLAINARDAMPEGGVLTIETSDRSLEQAIAGSEIEPGDYVELRMRDTGIGMSEEVRRRSVDPFFTTKPHGQGTGLGLSTAFAFVRQSNGHLSIESAPGRGTTVTILMPEAA